MRFCKECGTELHEEARFCRKCGASADLKSNETEPEKSVTKTTIEPAITKATETKHSGISQSQNRTNRNQPSNPRKPVSKKGRVIISASFVLIIGLVTTYFILSSFYTEEKAVEKFKQALSDQDAKMLAGLVYSDNANMEINKDTIGGFLDFLEKNPSYQGEIVDSLYDQVSAMKDSGSREAMASSESSVLELTKRGKKLLLFDDFKFKVQPYYFTVSTNYKDTDLFLNDEKIATADTNEYSKEVGPFLPGLYQVRAELENEYSTFDYEEELVLFNEMNDDYVDVHMEGYTIDVAADNNKGTLLVNGEKTDLNLEDELSFGPVPLDGSVTVQVQYDFPWGEEETSDEIPVEDSYVYIDNYDLPVSEDLQEILMDTGNDYIESFYEAYNNLDPGKVTNISDDHLEEVKENIDYIKEKDLRFKGILQKTIFNLDTFTLNEDDGEYDATVTFTIVSQVDEYDEEDEPDLSDEEETAILGFTYDESDDTWLVNELFYTYYPDDDANIKEFNLDESADEREDVSDKDSDKDDESASGDLSDYTAQEIEYARVWLEVNGDKDIDSLSVSYISSGEPVNSDDTGSADYPEEVIRLTADTGDIVTYSGNGDGTLNLYEVPSNWDDISNDDIGGFTDEIIDDTELVPIDPNNDETVIKMIEKLDIEN